MKKLLVGASALALSAGAVSAGGVDRSGQSVAALFKPGTYAELSFGSVNPNVSGTEVAPALGSDDSKNMTESYFSYGAALKHDYTDNLSVALIIDQPFGADVDYETGTDYFAQGSTAELNSHSITGLVRYKTAQNFSVYGGLRYQELEANAVVPFVTSGGPVLIPGAPYQANGRSDGGWGYVVGTSYERPDIAARVSLTYNSRIRHDLTTTESSAIAQDHDSTTTIDTPQSVNLDFQTGIAPGTLLFGGVRWVQWSEFDISPADYATLTSGASLVSYEDDTISYSLGLGRKFTEQWAGSVTVGYEKQNGGYASNLGPTDGNWSLGLGASYTMGNIEIASGVRYVWIGDAETKASVFEPAAEFENNHALGVGVRIGYTF